MGSKKQRAKAGKAGKDKDDSSMPSTQSPMAHQLVKKQTTTRSPTTVDKSDSPFLRIPREVRDKIYGELLIAKNPPEKEAQIDKIKACTSMPFGDFCRENALEGLDDTGIMPGGTRRYHFIVDALGLLLANKQIHAEANSVLFSENTFVILAEWERVWPFWRCDRTDCDPPNRPCFIMFHNFVQVKHLEIQVHNLQALESRNLRTESARLRANLQIVATCFTEAGNKLKTLKVRYTSCFGGEVEAMRDAIEGPLLAGAIERPIMLKDESGRYHQFMRAEAQRKLFTHCEAVLAPLLQMKGIADAVHVHGDLPTALIDKLTTTMSAPDPSGKVKKKLADERARKQAVLDKERRKDADQNDFWQKTMEKMLREGNQGSADLCRQMMGTSLKGPAVMADLMAPPSQEELARWDAGRPAREAALWASGTVTEIDDDEGEQDDVGTAAGGGIGSVNGKPIFGPPRPPGLE